MRLPAVVLLLVSVQLAGCVSGDDEPSVDDPRPTGGPPAVDEPPLVIAPRPGEGPRLASIVPRYVLTGFEGGEPTMGATSDGTLFMAADDEVIRSGDRGLTWEEVRTFGLERFGAPVDPITNNDPSMWVDTITDRVYHVPMWPALTCVQLGWSDDLGESWTDRPMQCNQLVTMDAQKLATGVRGPESGPLDLGSHPTVAYLCYGSGLGNEVNCVTSFDGGLTFPQLSTVHSGEGCPSGTGHPLVTPDGIVLVPAGEDCPRGVLGVSRDTGRTWSLVELSIEQEWGQEPTVDMDAAGHLYYANTGPDLLLQLAVGHIGAVDDPDRWHKVSVPMEEITAAVFPVVVAGDEGRIALSFVGTRMPVEDPSEAPDDTRWHLFILVAERAHTDAPTWTLHQVTPEDDPVQVGCIWLRGITIEPERPVPEISECRNLLDFNDSILAPDGTVYVAYTEGCTDGCAGEASARADDSRDQQVAVAWLEGLVLRSPDVDGPIPDSPRPSRP